MGVIFDVPCKYSFLYSILHNIKKSGDKTISNIRKQRKCSTHLWLTIKVQGIIYCVYKERWKIFKPLVY